MRNGSFHHSPKFLKFLFALKTISPLPIPNRSRLPDRQLQSSTGFLQPPISSFTFRPSSFAFPTSVRHVPDCHDPRQDPSRSTQPITAKKSTIGSSRVKLRVFRVKCAPKNGAPNDSWDSRRKRGIFFYFNLRKLEIGKFLDWVQSGVKHKY